MKPMSRSRAVGPTCIAGSIRPARRLSSCCRPNVTLIAAKMFLRLALSAGGPPPRVINVDGHPAYPQAIRELKTCGELSRRCRCRPSAYLNNVLEQDHRFLKRRMAASLWFRSVEGCE